MLAGHVARGRGPPSTIRVEPPDPRECELGDVAGAVG
jgi:hypothetical protein